MALKYEYDDFWTHKARIIAKTLFFHVKIDRIACIKSTGSKSKRIIARIHSLGKAMQTAMNCEPFYAIELLEIFYKQNKKEQLDTIVHELMHIPKAFGGGLKGHKGHITKKRIELLLSELQKKGIS